MIPPDPGIDPALLDQYCFGCGRHNPVGFHLVFERDGEEMVTRYEPKPEDQGFPGIMHGGLLALLLDEAMGWAMYADQVFAVTAKMEMRYRRPAGLDAPLTVRSRIERRRGRRIELVATVSDPDGATLVDAKGLFVRMPPEQEAEALATFRAQGREEGREAGAS